MTYMNHYELMFMCVNEVNLLSFDFQFTIYDHKMYVLITEVLTCSVHYFPQQRLTVVLALATLVSAFGSSFQYGYNVAVINSPAPVTTAKKKKNVKASMTMCLSSVHAAVLQHHLPAALWPTHGEELPHSPLVSLSLHVSAGGLLWLSDGGSSGQ